MVVDGFPVGAFLMKGESPCEGVIESSEFDHCIMSTWCELS
jgi:hypothetical protein